MIDLVILLLLFVLLVQPIYFESQLGQAYILFQLPCGHQLVDD